MEEAGDDNESEVSSIAAPPKEPLTTQERENLVKDIEAVIENVLEINSDLFLSDNSDASTDDGDASPGNYSVFTECHVLIQKTFCRI